MTRNFLGAGILLSLVSFGYSGEITLHDGWAKLQTDNHALEAARARSEGAQATRMAAYGGFLPVVRLEASVNHMDRDLVMDLNPIRDALIELQSRDQASLYVLQQSMAAQAAGQTLTPEQQAAMSAGARAKAAAAYEASLPPFETVLKEQDHWTAALSAYQPLFHGGKILSINRAAAAKSRAAAADTIRQLADLKRDYAKYYIQGAMLRRSIALRLEALEAIGHHRDRAKKLVEEGMADRSALLRADLAVAEATTALADDSAKLATLQVALAQLSGSSDPQLPSDKLPDPPVPPAGPSSDVSGNPLLASIQANREAASSATWIKAGEFLPEIGAFGKYELHREALSALDPYWIVGVRGTWTLFRGGTDAMNWKAARSQEAEAVAMHKEATSLLAVQRTRQYLSWTQARGKWERMASQESLAFENHRVAELRFQQGQGTSLDVVDAWLSREKAGLERLAASGEAWNAALEARWSEGRVDDFGSMWNNGGAR